MKAKLFFLFLFIPALLLAQDVADFSNSSLFLKLKPEYNDLNRSVSEKFDISSLQQLRLQYPVKEIKLSGNRKLQNTYVIYFENDENIKQVVEAYQQTGLFEYVSLNQTGIAGGQ